MGAAQRLRRALLSVDAEASRVSCRSFVVGMGVCRRGRQALPRDVRSGRERRSLVGAAVSRFALTARQLREPGRLDGAAAVGAWATGAGAVSVVIIGGRGPAASARDEGEEGSVAAVSAAVRPLL